MFIAVPTGASPWISRKEEDIHSLKCRYLSRILRQTSIFLFQHSQQMSEAVFTELYEKNRWGSQETRSGPGSTLQRTEKLRSQLPGFFQELKIQSILDCGCGDWNWMRHVDLSGIQYIGAEIVDPLLNSLQQTYTTEHIKFEKLNCLRDPPEKTDLWIARDLLNLVSISSIRLFFHRFLESKSSFLAVTSVESYEPFEDPIEGSMRPLNLREAPLNLPEPEKVLDDGQQWFRPKKLLVYTRQQILDWFMEITFMVSNIEVALPPVEIDIQDRNAHLQSNVKLKNMSLHDHRG
jgi:hypothetical protein